MFSRGIVSIFTYFVVLQTDCVMLTPGCVLCGVTLSVDVEELIGIIVDDRDTLSEASLSGVFVVIASFVSSSAVVLLLTSSVKLLPVVWDTVVGTDASGTDVSVRPNSGDPVASSASVMGFSGTVVMSVAGDPDVALPGASVMAFSGASVVAFSGPSAVAVFGECVVWAVCGACVWAVCGA